MSAPSYADGKRVLVEHTSLKYQRQNFAESWRNLPEIPTRAEIMPSDMSAEDLASGEENWVNCLKQPNDNLRLPKNIVDGPWASKEAYIAAHYKILREDAIFSLRMSVASVKLKPTMKDNSNTSLYTFVSWWLVALGENC